MLLLNPSIDSKTQPLLVRYFTYATFPTGLGFLAAFLREKNKAAVRIHDEQILPLNEEMLKIKIDELVLPIIGISCLTVTAKRAFELSRQIKKQAPKALVVLGGVHPTALPEETLLRSAADIVVRGEGEKTLSEIYEAVKSNKDFRKIKGISYKKGNEIIHNEQREIIMNLEEIPPFPYDLFEENIEHYKDFGTIISSRGCPFSCIFCSQRIISGRNYRFLPNQRVVAKIKLLVEKYKQTKIWFMDDSYASNKTRLFSLLDAIIDSGYHKKVAFIAQARGKDISEEIVAKMKQANFISIAFGVETASERLMSQLNKGETVQDNINAIIKTHKAGILTDASFIMGLPGETKEDRIASRKLALELPLDGGRFNIAIPYPGTRLNEIAQKEGRLNISEDWVNCSNQNYLSSDDIPYAPVGTSRVELIYDTFIANLTFSLRPKTLRKILFTSKLSGGSVISMPSNWFASPKLLLTFLRIGFLVTKRFVSIVVKRNYFRFFNENQ